MRQCPYCAESIQDAAVICRFCNRELPKQAPAGQPPAPAAPAPARTPATLQDEIKKAPKWQLGCLAIIFIGGGLAWISSLVGGSGSSQATTAAAVAQAATPVELNVLLGDYKGNEVGADAKYKGKRIQTSGLVGEVKKDILDRPYVVVGHGRDFEIPEVQCFLASSHAASAGSLRKGQTITVTGKVQGLMMNVLMEDCTF